MDLKILWQVSAQIVSMTKYSFRAREMSKWSGALAAHTEDLNLVASTSMVAYRHPQLQFQGTNALFQFHKHQARIWCSYIHTEKTLIHIKVIINA